MNNEVNSNTGDTVIVKKEVPSPLMKEKSPCLGGDLDALGHVIKNVADIKTKRINGIDLEKEVGEQRANIDSLRDELSEATDAIEESAASVPKLKDALDILKVTVDRLKFAPTNHSHTADAITDLQMILGKYLNNYQEKGEYADKEHTHGEFRFLKEMIEDTSKVFESRLESLDSRGQDLLLMKRELDESIKDMEEYIKSVEKLIQGVSADIGLKKERVEICTFVQSKGTIPKPLKAEGMDIVQVFAVDSAGKEVDVKYVKNGRMVKVEVPKPAFVHVLYE